MSTANETLYRRMAAKIPANIRKTLLEERLIDMAVYTSEVEDSPMGYLFDVYEEFLDPTGEHDNFFCHKCKLTILTNFREMKPYLEELKP